MFKVIADRRAWWPVIFAGVSEEGGVVANEIELRFRLVDEDQMRELVGKFAELAEDDAGLAAYLKLGELFPGEPISLSMMRAALVMRIADDWRKVGAENGEPLRFAPENVLALVKVPNAFDGIARAFIACWKAEPEIRAGN
ncbi:hypothetical protein [Sphingomonas sp. CCH15-F11]|uniref:hypothetical protein n=1 Tax=Sphingomonas sp. CCH15-F11 TaxID=1768785 RepID=UPI00082C7898|nr:hypothetical protein [Sphingomonas sp. CCH15-F11]